MNTTNASREEEPNQESNLEAQIYLQERNSLHNAVLDVSRLLDKSILTLSAGVFGLSLAFIRDIVGTSAPTNLGLLAKAWYSFEISITVTLAALLTSQLACHNEARILDSRYRTGCVDNQENNNDVNYWTYVTLGLNVAAISSFLLGAIWLSAFVISNLSRGN